MSDIVKVTSLYDSTKKHAQFYKKGDVYAQIHTRLTSVGGFGEVYLTVTGSQCDEAGTLITKDGARLILGEGLDVDLSHSVTLQTATEPDVEGTLEAARLIVAERVFNSIKLSDTLGVIGGVGEPLGVNAVDAVFDHEPSESVI